MNRAEVKALFLECLAECGITPKKPRKKKAVPLIKFDPLAFIQGRYTAPGFTGLWVKFCNYRAERKKGLTEQSAALIFNKFNSWTVDECLVAMENALENNWTTVWKPEQNNFTKPAAPVEEAGY